MESSELTKPFWTIDLIQDVKVSNILAEASRLANKLRSGLKDIGFSVVDHEGPFVNFYSQFGEKIKEAEQKLKQAQIAYAPHRGPGIRLSTHAYNRDAEIEYLLNKLS